MPSAASVSKPAHPPVVLKLSCGCKVVRKWVGYKYQNGIEGSLNAESKLCKKHDRQLTKAIEATGATLKLEAELEKLKS